MKLEPFALERLQSVWENRVDWNISESGVQPLRVEDLVDDPALVRALLAQELGYPQTNGTVELRGLLAGMYPGATSDHVLVTNGGSEANCVTLIHLVDPGDHVVMMTPNYMQVAGLARALGATVSAWPLRPGSDLDCFGDAQQSRSDPRWAPDLEALGTLVTERTKLIIVCNPNNPTGARLTGSELDAVCRIAARVNAWVLSDEIYRGAELDGRETDTIWGRYDRVVVTSGLSKAYGLAGLRIGWVVAPPPVVEALWGIHDYTTIAPGGINDRLARIALAPERRARLLARTRGILLANYPIVRDWIDRRAPRLSHIPPEAGAIVFVRYHHTVKSTTLVERIRNERNVLVVPGDHFDMDGYLRIGYGSDQSHLVASLERIGDVLDTIPAALTADAR
jgi:aspartate/methionine/tyrosine aminotransferase